jgi:hypothetical protein
MVDWSERATMLAAATILRAYPMMPAALTLRVAKRGPHPCPATATNCRAFFEEYQGERSNTSPD